MLSNSIISRVALYQASVSDLCDGTPSVCLSVRKVFCGKTADWIRMPFGMVSGVGRGMGVVIVEGEGAVLWLNLGRPDVTNGDFATRLFPNYSGR